MTLTTEYQMLAEKYLGYSYGSLYIRIYARYTSQDEINLTSTVQYQARAYFSGSSYIYDANSSGTITGTGATSQNYSKSSRYDPGETTLATITGTVTHDATTGEASVSASASLNFPNWSWSETASGTANLPTIDISTLRFGINNQWVKATPYLAINGQWVKCKAYLGVNNQWKKGV